VTVTTVRWFGLRGARGAAFVFFVVAFRRWEGVFTERSAASRLSWGVIRFLIGP
jgi:hypothetical protein